MKLTYFIISATAFILFCGCAHVSDHPVETQWAVDIDKTGTVAIYGAQCTRSQFEFFLRKKTQRDGPFPVTIRSSSETPFDRVVPVIKLLEKYGIQKISFTTTERTMKDLASDHMNVNCNTIP